MTFKVTDNHTIRSAIIATAGLFVFNFYDVFSFSSEFRTVSDSDLSVIVTVFITAVNFTI